MKNNTSCRKSKIGGQALLEGIMMRGLDRVSMAVRLPNGNIDIENWKVSDLNNLPRHRKIPFLRGCFSLVESLKLGIVCLNKSAEKLELSDEEAVSKEGSQKNSNISGKVASAVGTIIGLLLFLVIFLYMPALFAKALFPSSGLRALFEGLIKILLFLLYILLISRMKEIHRTFGYHGAEHKSIFCYEAGEPLTVENVKKYSRFHPRCGTSFLFLVLIVGILIFSVVSWKSLWIRVLLKLLLLPVVVGISYELIRIAGKYDCIATRVISAPGLWLQRLTTKEPDDGQIEVAIAALSDVLPENPEEDQW